MAKFGLGILGLLLMAEVAAEGGAAGAAGDATLLGGEGAPTGTVDGATGGQGDSSSGANGDASGQPSGGAGDGQAAGDGNTTGDKSAVEYTDFVVPDGVTLQPELLGEFKETAKALGLNQEQAQKLADLGVKQAQTFVQAQQAALEAQKTTWLDAVKADKEIGGDKLQENLAVALRAVNAFVSPELKALLDSTGLGNHPDMVKAFYKAGKLISEDSLLPGGNKPAGAGRSVAQSLYPDQA